ncbi:MAG: ribosomal protein L11 methyltransferase [Gammaproteobacteria bacterium RIFCSPHIGHO2_12_FULL_45_9]|nr:MAG: ribosomal protein L11 methyltransferase [Gammaproteobacteria bacterium RIFCSPHIGHO2_12_FULL_45_9]
MWKQVQVQVSSEEAESLASFLENQGALSVTFSDAMDVPIFKEAVEGAPLWPLVTVTALFSKDFVENTLHIYSPKRFRAVWDTITVSVLEDQDWVRLTQQHFPPIAVTETLWVLSSWEDTAAFAGTQVRIDPGLAFGTGTHPTTRLCLQWIAQHVPAGAQVIDYGCGSGILALTALACGATHVTAVDHDPQALEATQHNATLNAFVTPDSLTVGFSTGLSIPPTQYVLANILSGVLIQLASTLTALTVPGGYLILSGLLATELTSVYAHYAASFAVVEEQVWEEWALLVLKRRLF